MVTRIGFIGLSGNSWAARAHMRSLGELPNDYKVTATLTTRQESADEAARVYGIKGYHGDPSQLANDPDVDLVVVSVKVPYHAPGIRAAIEAGKDVFSEWPLALDLKEAEELAALAKSKSVRTMVGLQAMQDPGVIKAKELVDGGVIGRVLATHLIASGGGWGAETNQQMAYLLDNSNGRFLSSSISLLTCAGASLLTIPCSHTLEALNFVLGDFAYLSANLANRRTTATIQETGETVPFTAADQILIQGALKSGAVASIHYRGGAAKGGIDYHWEIEGEQGIIMFKGSNGPQVLDIFFTLPERKLTRLKRILPAMYLNGEQIQHREDKEDRLGNIGREYEAFAEKDPAHYVDFDHAVARHKIIEAIEQSSKADGKRINF